MGRARAAGGVGAGVVGQEGILSNYSNWGGLSIEGGPAWEDDGRQVAFTTTAL